MRLSYKKMGRAGYRAGMARIRAEERKIVIRCAWCLQVFCARCAKLHFAPIAKAQRAVDLKLAKAAARAMDTLMRGHR